MRLAEGRCQPERLGADEKPSCPYSASPIIPIPHTTKIKTPKKKLFIFLSIENGLYFFNGINIL